MKTLRLTDIDAARLQSSLEARLQDIEIERDSFMVRDPCDPQFGRVVINGVDMTENIEKEKAAVKSIVRRLMPGMRPDLLLRRRL